MSYEMDVTVTIPVEENGFVPHMVSGYTYRLPVNGISRRICYPVDTMNEDVGKHKVISMLNTLGIHWYRVSISSGPWRVAPSSVSVVDIRLVVKEEICTDSYTYKLFLAGSGHRYNRYNNPSRGIRHKTVTGAFLATTSPDLVLYEFLKGAIKQLRGAPLYTTYSHSNPSAYSHLRDNVHVPTIRLANGKVIKKSELTIYDRI